MNVRYNNIRSLAQYFMEGRDLALNLTYFKASRKRIEGGFFVETKADWLGDLALLIKGGKRKDIVHLHPDRGLLLKELSKDPIGYLVMQPRHVEVLFPDGDISFLSLNGTKMFIPVAEEADKDLRNKFEAAGIPVRATYSAEEIGYIGTECEECPGAFHVPHSNVIVEVDDRDSVVVDGNRLGNVLVTHLHSYATPFVRYEIGDFAMLANSCACGHDGPVLKNIYGRKKRLVKRADGSVSPFSVSAGNLLKIVKCDEFRIRQTELTTIEVEIGGVDQLSAVQLDSLTKLLKDRAGAEFEIQIRAVRNIDWGNDTKRLGFSSDLF